MATEKTIRDIKKSYAEFSNLSGRIKAYADDYSSEKTKYYNNKTEYLGALASVARFCNEN